jgi:2'-5' RNA ligase
MSSDEAPSGPSRVLRGAIIVPVPEAEPLVGAWRQRYDPSATRGVPAHITLLYPFLAAADLGTDGLLFLENLFAATQPVRARLVAVAEFPGVLYLAPEPASWFADLTHALSERFGLLPYGGLYEHVTPHLTVAHGAEPAAMASISAQLSPRLPIAFAAGEAWLMEQRDQGVWQHEATFPVGTRCR